MGVNQKKIHEYLLHEFYASRHGRYLGKSVEEIREAVCANISISMVRQSVNGLVKKGYLNWQYRNERTGKKEYLYREKAEEGPTK